MSAGGGSGGRRIALVATHHAEYAANLALALAKRHRVLLILSARNAARQLEDASIALLRRHLTLTIVPHHYAPLQPLVAALCHRAVRRFAPDVVQIQEHPTRATYWLARLIGVRLPIVTTVHDPAPHSGADARAAEPLARYIGGLRALSDRMIVHGERLVPALGTLLPDGTARVRSAAHGVLRFGMLMPQPDPLPDPQARLIMFGRMNRYKGLDLLLDANDRLLASGDAPPLLIAGAGPEVARLAERIAAAPNVTLRAGRLPQAELAALVRGSAAAILPYHDATQSGAAASAFGAGRPVIATAVGALPDVIRDGDNGLLTAPGDAAALAAAIRRLAREPGLRLRLEQGVARTVADALSWDAIAAATERVHAEAIDHAALKL